MESCIGVDDMVEEEEEVKVEAKGGEGDQGRE